MTYTSPQRLILVRSAKATLPKDLHILRVHIRRSVVVFHGFPTSSHSTFQRTCPHPPKSSPPPVPPSLRGPPETNLQRTGRWRCVRSLRDALRSLRSRTRCRACTMQCFHRSEVATVHPGRGALHLGWSGTARGRRHFGGTKAAKASRVGPSNGCKVVWCQKVLSSLVPEMWM